MVRSSFMVITLLSDLFHSLGNEAADVHIAVGEDGGDLNNFSGGGNGFGVRREEFEDMVDGDLREDPWVAAGGKCVHNQTPRFPN